MSLVRFLDTAASRPRCFAGFWAPRPLLSVGPSRLTWQSEGLVGIDLILAVFLSRLRALLPYADAAASLPRDTR